MATYQPQMEQRSNSERSSATYGRTGVNPHLQDSQFQGAGHDRVIDRTEEKADSGESRNDSGAPEQVGFLDKRLKKTILNALGKWVLTTAILCTAILGILSLYWGVLFNVEQNLNSLIIFVVDFETDPNPLVGPLITSTTEGIVAMNAMPHLGFITIPSSAYNNDPIAVRQAVYDQEAWAAIVINPNATTLLRQAVEQGNSSYEPIGACQVIYTTSRDQDTYYDYVLPLLNTLETQVITEFGQQWTAQVLGNNSISRTALAAAPQALSPAIGFSTYDLRPFFPYTATPAVTIGLIYLIIIAFFSFSFFLPIHLSFLNPEQGHPVLKFWQFLLWRWIMTMLAYLFMSLAYSLISLAFQIPFSNHHAPETVVAQNANPFGRATFVVYWMVNFLGMGALGLASENVTMIIGQPWTALWLIFWVITNVSTSFYAEELSPGFYRWGFAWPLHSVVEASRTLIFDLKNRLGLDFGILLAWVAINTFFFPFCCWFMKYKSEKAKKAEQEKKEK